MQEKYNCPISGVPESPGLQDPEQLLLDGQQSSSGIAADELDEILRGHAIDPGSLRVADFDTFFTMRIKALLGWIELAMGKPSVRAEIAQGVDSDSPDTFDVEPAETEPEILYHEESPA